MSQQLYGQRRDLHKLDEIELQKHLMGDAFI